MYLYRLTNTATQKAYIGTSVNPISHRVSRHLYAAKCGRKDMAIACAIRKHGLAAFSVEQLATSDSYEALLKMEADAIAMYGTMAPAGYNISAGGRGARRPCSEATRAAISAKTMGRKPWNLGMKTGPLSGETKIKLSAIRKGRKAWNKGIPHRPETLAKFATRIPWNRGKKTGPMSEPEKLKRSEGVKKARALKFWSTKRKASMREAQI